MYMYSVHTDYNSDVMYSVLRTVRLNTSGRGKGGCIELHNPSQQQPGSWSATSQRHLPTSKSCHVSHVSPAACLFTGVLRVISLGFHNVYATSSSLPLIPFLSSLSFEIGRETRCFAYSGYQPSDITSSLSSLLVSSCLEAAARQRHFIIHRHVLTYRLRHDSSLFPQLLEQHTIIFSLPSFQTL